MFRVLAKIGGVLSDITEQVYRIDDKAQTLAVANGDCLYLGSRLKFNSAYFGLNTSALASAIGSVSVYNGSSFDAVADVQDWTKGFTESGNLTFTPKKNNGGWQKKDTNEISELNTFEIYGLCWAKVSFNGSHSLEFEFIGHKFSDDLDLFAEYPIIGSDEVKAYFGETNFDKQAIIAAQSIEDSLMKMGSIDGIEQVLTVDDLRLASVSKVAEIVLGSCGTTYAEKTAVIKAEYEARIAKAFPVIDTNNNAIADGNARVTMGRLYR